MGPNQCDQDVIGAFKTKTKPNTRIATEQTRSTDYKSALATASSAKPNPHLHPDGNNKK